MIYLASTSPRRRRLLQKAGIPFRVLHPTYVEVHRAKAAPAKIVQRHALEKARSCVKQIKRGTLLGADTVVYLKGRTFGKPRSREEACRILEMLAGRWHTVYTGVALLNVVAGRIVKKTVFFEKTKVRLRSLTRKGIENYFKKVKPLDKAGAYAIQSRHGGIIQEVKGSFSNAVGLPLQRVLQELSRNFPRPHASRPLR